MLLLPLYEDIKPRVAVLFETSKDLKFNEKDVLQIPKGNNHFK